MTFDHEEIRRTTLRSYSEPLFAALIDSGNEPDEQTEIVGSLRELDDPRLRARLLAIVMDPVQPDRLRVHALDILDWSEDYLTDEEWLNVWNLGDPVLQDRALAHLNDLTVVLPIAQDPHHPLYRSAISALSNVSEHIELAVAAMSHPDADVRAAAVDAVLWDEPVTAIEPAIRCLADEAGHVRNKAEDALQYFFDTRVLLALNPKSKSYASIQNEFTRVLYETPSIASWMRPCVQLLGPKPEEINYSISRDTPPVDLTELFDLLADPNSSRERLHHAARFRYECIQEEDRASLRLEMRSHADPVVRYCLVEPLARWGDTEDVLAFLNDPSQTVRQSARYALRYAPPNRAVAAALLPYLRLPKRRYNWAETLTSFVHHADRPDAVRFLVDRMRNTPLFDERFHCLSNLVELGEREHVQQVMHWFEGPAQVNWQIHITLLEACQKLAIPLPRLPDLSTVTDLRFAEAIVKAQTSSVTS